MSDPLDVVEVLKALGYPLAEERDVLAVTVIVQTFNHEENETIEDAEKICVSAELLHYGDELNRHAALHAVHDLIEGVIDDEHKEQEAFDPSMN